MTDLATCGFTGGSLGDAITTTTEPFFTSSLGTITYGDGGSGRLGLKPTPTNTGQLYRDNAGGRTTFSIRWKVRFESSTATTSYWNGLTLRAGSTNLADIGLRNASGARHAALRGTSSVYYGEATGNTMAAGEVWTFEAVVNGTALTVYVWEGDQGYSSLPAPTYTWSTTMAATPDNYWFGAAALTNVSAVISDIRFTDGAQAGTVAFTSNAWASSSELVVAAKVADAATVRIEATPTGGGTTLVGSETAPTDNYVRVAVAGLAANTSYDWTIYVDNTVRKTGTITTLPAAGAPTAFSFAWGSCFDTNTSGVFALIAARNPAFFGMVGDWGYQYITGGANGNTSPTDQTTIRTHRETVLAAAIPQAFFAGRPTSYTYSDCDGAGANADSTTGGHANGSVQAAYRQQFAHPTLPLTNSGARSWVIGRVRFVHTDETAAASDKAATDNSSKTKLGAEQKAWFKAQIDAAVAAGQVVVWLGDGPWVTPTGNGSSNEWARYNTERTELGTYIAASGVKIIRLHGDAHTLFYDDGSHNSWGGFPTACAAPIHTTGQTYGYTISGGKWPTSTTNSSRQYGIASVADTGDDLTITLKGYSSTTGAPTEVERFSGEIAFDMTPPVSTSSPALVLGELAETTPDWSVLIGGQQLPILGWSLTQDDADTALVGGTLGSYGS